MKAEVRGMHCKAGGRGRKPRTVGSHEKLKQARKLTPLEPPERTCPARTVAGAS